jgi:hypothetical protein
MIGAPAQWGRVYTERGADRTQAVEFTVWFVEVHYVPPIFVVRDVHISLDSNSS